MSIENQHIFLATRTDLGVGGWCPYGVRILNPLKIIGRSIMEFLFNNVFWNSNYFEHK